MEEQLRAQTKAAIFEKQFAQAFERVLNDKRSGASDQHYADKVNRDKYTTTDGYQEIQPFTVEGDDKNLRVAKWNSLLKDSAFYFDVPNLQQQRDMRKKLQYRYDDLFPEQTMRFPL